MKNSKQLAEETTIFIVNKNLIEETNLYDFVMISEDETTSPRGVAPRIFYEKNEQILYRFIDNIVIDEFDYEELNDEDRKFYTIETNEWFEMRTWGCTGNREKSLGYRFDTEEEAQNFIYEGIYNFDFQGDCNRRTYYHLTYEDALNEVIENYCDEFDISQETAKHIYRKELILAELKIEKYKLTKIKSDNRPLISIGEMENYIEQNRYKIQEKIILLNQLKESNNKEIWQKEANSLIMQVANNDFRTLNWKEIYSLIKSKF